MIVLDLFCGAGGAGMGYKRAGFDVVGVDIRPQPRYPFEFIQADALGFLRHFIGTANTGVVAVHASPPCQRYSKGAGRWQTRDRHPDLIDATRTLLAAAGLPYVIENIEQARPLLHSPITLCGEMFDLGVFRHRCFECAGFDLWQPSHRPHQGRIGDGRYFTVAGNTGGSSARDGWKGGSIFDWRKAMGIGWMTSRELAQAIPPAYTEYIGRHLAAAI